MSRYEVVTNIVEIVQLNRRLAKHLKTTFKFRRERVIGYPGGQVRNAVFFEQASGKAVRGWSPYKEDDKIGNFLLTGDPASTETMVIDVQLNFPAQQYLRRVAGAFVKDERGDVFVAHRGKLAKGRAGLPMDKVFRDFAARTVYVEDDGRVSRLILLSALDDPALANRLWDFAAEAREVATRISLEDASKADAGSSSANRRKAGADGDGKTASSAPKDPVMKLRDYFDEYAGEGTSKGHDGGKRIVEHGDVVWSLEQRLRPSGKTQKAQAIDLAVVDKEVLLFEVKTSSRTTDVYTGVGQLLIHGECIQELLTLPVRRFLVLPSQPRPSHGKHLPTKAGIEVVTFAKNGGSYEFDGLP